MPKRTHRHTPERERPNQDAALALVAGEAAEAIRPGASHSPAPLAPIWIGPAGELVFDFSGDFPPLDVVKAVAESYAVREAMQRANGSQKRAAELLKTTPSIVFNALRRMNGAPVRPSPGSPRRCTSQTATSPVVAAILDAAPTPRRGPPMPKNEPTRPDVVTVETLPLGNLVALAERLYRSQHAPLRSQNSPEWLVEREQYLRVERELNARVEAMTEPVMVALYRALLAEDIDALDNAVDGFRTLPPIAQRWAFAFWPVDPEENDEGDVEPTRFLDSAIELRRLARRYAGKKGAKE